MILLFVLCLGGPVTDLHAQGAAPPKDYTLLFKGEPVPYDTAVAMDVKTYRQESLKFDIADKTINDQKASITKLERTNTLLLDQANTGQKINIALNEQISADAKTKEDLRRRFEKLQKTANRGPGLFGSPLFWGPVGAVAGYVLCDTIKDLIN